MTSQFTTKTWGCKLEIPPDFLAYGINCGEILAYAAERVIAVVNDRTDKGIDAGGSPFPPYKKRTKIAVDGDGPIERDARGRWTKESARRIIRDKFGRWTEILIDGPQGLRTLRSQKIVTEGTRMRDSLRYTPAFPKPTTKTVWVFPQGGRDGFSHAGRAKSLRGQRIEWLDLLVDEVAFVNADIRKIPTSAWLTTNRKRRVDWNIKKAQAAEKTIRRAKKKGDDVKLARAEARHKAHMAELQRLGVAYEEKGAPAMGRPRKTRGAG